MRDLPEVVVRYLSAYNKRDVEGMLACLAEDVSFRNISSGSETIELTGRAAFEELARQGAAAFSARRQSVLNYIVVDDLSVLDIEFTATVAQDMENGWRAGQELRFSGASAFTVRDGLIVRLVDES